MELCHSNLHGWLVKRNSRLFKNHSHTGELHIWHDLNKVRDFNELMLVELLDFLNILKGYNILKIKIYWYYKSCSIPDTAKLSCSECLYNKLSNIALTFFSNVLF